MELTNEKNVHFKDYVFYYPQTSHTLPSPYAPGFIMPTQHESGISNGFQKMTFDSESLLLWGTMQNWIRPRWGDKDHARHRLFIWHFASHTEFSLYLAPHPPSLCGLFYLSSPGIIEVFQIEVRGRFQIDLNFCLEVLWGISKAGLMSWQANFSTFLVKSQVQKLDLWSLNAACTVPPTRKAHEHWHKFSINSLNILSLFLHC